MNGTDEHSTIAAIATPPGRGGIAVLRISGPDALAVLGRLFAPARGGSDDFSEPRGTDGLSERGGSGDPSAAHRGADFVFKPRRLHYGRALDGRSEVLDEALAVYMPGPASATGEDVGELHCHAGPGICAALLEAAVTAGAVPAGPGDFTRRAFLNGRLDLTQAEAVAELCDARTGTGARLAAAKLDGALGRETARLRGALDDLRLQCVLDADFPEEEAEHLGEAAFSQRVDDCASTLRRLLSAYERARFWREGASAVLAGRVNAGKSSLLNALLGRERAIVSDTPGTTRDYLEESLNLGGLEVRLTDTAGLRAGGGSVETEGMRRACALAEQADLVIFVKDVRDVVNPEAADVPHSGRFEVAADSEKQAPHHRARQFLSAAEGNSVSGEGTLYPEEKDFLRLHAGRCRSGGLIAVLNKIDTLPCPEAARRALEDFSAALGDVMRECPRNADGNREKSLRGSTERMHPGTAGAAQAKSGAAQVKHRVAGPAAAQKIPAAVRAVPVCAAVSALRGDGLDVLSETVRAALTAQGRLDPGDAIPNLRQSALMRAALEELNILEEERTAGCPRDMLALRLEHAARLLDEVSGASGNKELLDRIFSSFCIGK